MIRQAEIRKRAEEFEVPADVVDKDWVLGHLLSAIFSRPTLAQKLIFKGGTCLRKCYFPGYRFSEDLDFTCTSTSLDESEIRLVLDELNGREEIPMVLSRWIEVVAEDRKVGWDADIRYWGANHNPTQPPPAPDRWMTSVKLEIRHFEIVVNSPVQKPLLHPYSDSDGIGFVHIPCYAVEEMLAEKFRALLQRSYKAPRDFYDIWYLFHNVDVIDWPLVKSTLLRKAAFKSTDLGDFQGLYTPSMRQQTCAAWVRSLKHQMKSEQLPDCEAVIHEVEQLTHRVIGP